MMSNRPILILSPTEIEIFYFRRFAVPGCVVEVCGIGGAQTAATTAAAIVKHDPKMVILAGIAGAYTGSELAIGECLLIDRETVADMGAFRKDGFTPMFATQYACPYTEPFTGFAKCGSNSVNACAAPYVAGSQEYKIENMEGAAFFALCIALGLPFLELRAVSNMVSASREGWDIPAATKQLSETLIKLINEINA